MKEKLYTIPIHDAMAADTECPFCYMEKKIEEDTVDFVLGNSASYMERDIRALTDQAGFCREHFKKMNDYGNTLGNGWILKTHYMKKMDELQRAFAENGKGTSKKTLGFGKKESSVNPITALTKAEKNSCYICQQIKKDYERYLETFIILYNKDEEFRKKVKESKGFCLTHLGDLCEVADKTLKSNKLEEFYNDIEEVMMKNLERTFEDVSWLIEKFDYRNRDADWKNSRDAVPRAMQKMKGGF